LELGHGRFLVSVLLRPNDQEALFAGASLMRFSDCALNAFDRTDFFSSLPPRRAVQRLAFCHLGDDFNVDG
jgi:hypothetical protein